MDDGSVSTIRRLFQRSNARNSRSQVTLHSSVVHPPSLHEADDSALRTLESQSVAEIFISGTDLLRVTRKKARTRKFVIDAESGSVLVDNVLKFKAEAIRDIRVGEDASHYRELCKISSEHEPRWLSLVYYQESQKLKVLHVICPNTDVLKLLKNSLEILCQRCLRIAGSGLSLFGRDHTSLDVEMWYSLMPDITSSHYSQLPKVITGRGIVDDSTQLSNDSDVTPSLSFDQIESLCHKLHFNASSALLSKIFAKVNNGAITGALDFAAFKKFVALLKTRHDITQIYNSYKSINNQEMTRDEFLTFLRQTQGLRLSQLELHKIFDRAREPTSSDRKENISATNFTSYILSRHNSLLYSLSTDMTQPLHQYYISSSHNTYLPGRQVGDESSIEPYIQVLQRGCRCIEIDIWSDSDGYPEVRHGRAFTAPIRLESVLKVIDKYAFIVSPWPLIISLEIRCSPKTQIIVTELLTQIFGEVLVTTRLDSKLTVLPSPEDLRHRIILKVKAADHLSRSLQALDQSQVLQRTTHSDTVHLGLDDTSCLNADESSFSTSAQESDDNVDTGRSRASSISSRSSSYSGVSIRSYRPFSRPSFTIEELNALAPYLHGIKFRNFSLPECKTFNHVVSLSERSIKQFSKETCSQLQKHNTRCLMRVYPSQARVLSSNFLPHRYWQLGVQMAAMNWQTHDIGMRVNEAFFAKDDQSSDTLGYQLKPPHLTSWEKGQDKVPRRWSCKRWEIQILSGSQLSATPGSSGKVSPFVELDVLRPVRSSSLPGTPQRPQMPSIGDKERVSKFRTAVVDDNGFNPEFHSTLCFTLFEDEDPYFTFLDFKAQNSVSGDILGQCCVPLQRMQQGYRVVGLYDVHGEKSLFSTLLIKVTSRSTDVA